MDLDTANAHFDDLVHKKKLKGYCEAIGQAPYVGSDKENKITGVLPQLLNNIDEEDLDAYFDYDNYCLQEKKDGKRILIRATHGTIEAINRKGLLVGFPAAIEGAAQKLVADCLFDGEMIGEVIWLFDALELDMSDLRNLPYSQRYKILQQTVSVSNVEGSPVRLVETAFNAQKKTTFGALKKQGVEGVVFKKLDAIYKPGRPSSGGDQLKFKFTNTCTCQVAGSTEKGKRSVYIQMLDGETLIDVGKVTVLPNFAVPKVGTLVEIKYLYRHVHGALYQPIYLGERDDLEKADQVSTVKVKEGIEDEDEL
jgi:bifunctional non-homologous end joining protein LigD